MEERAILLASIAKEIETYRQGEIPKPTPMHVDKWARQFSPENQLAFLREFNHVIKETFITEAGLKAWIENLVTNAKVTGGTPASYWRNANFLKIQKNGQSQKEMLKLFTACLYEKYQINLDTCGVQGGDFIYLDDLIFSGNRVGNDLNDWIINHAPASARVLVIVAAIHSSGDYFLKKKKLVDVIKASGKSIEINYWRALTIENSKYYKNSSGVLWPESIPDVESVRKYMSIPSKFPFEPRQPTPNTVWPFSSQFGRQVLEREFLIAGAKIIAKCDNPKTSMRPLGFSPFGVGFGSMLSTYRNCPNNCPLALWWGNSGATSGALEWYPLLPRKTYASPENVFDVFPPVTF
ncbi:MAG: hypothetical protein LPK11_12760 [Chromatiaceae bacterium]|nr:hypothetical protein [Chromatiaceae bacterium]